MPPNLILFCDPQLYPTNYILFCDPQLYPYSATPNLSLFCGPVPYPIPYLPTLSPNLISQPCRRTFVAEPCRRTSSPNFVAEPWTPNHGRRSAAPKHGTELRAPLCGARTAAPTLCGRYHGPYSVREIPWIQTAPRTAAPTLCGRYHGSELRRELRRLLCAGDTVDPNPFAQLGPQCGSKVRFQFYLSETTPCGTSTGNCAVSRSSTKHMEPFGATDTALMLPPSNGSAGANPSASGWSSAEPVVSTRKVAPLATML